MTFQQAIWVFMRPWIDGSVTISEWCLACAIIQAANDCRYVPTPPTGGPQETL